MAETDKGMTWKEKKQDPKKPISISYSRLSLFGDCPAQFYFRYMTDLKVAETTWPGTIFGKAMHKVLEFSFPNATITGSSFRPSAEDTFEAEFVHQREKAGAAFKMSRGYSEAETIANGRKLAPRLVQFMSTYLGDAFVEAVPEADHVVAWNLDAVSADIRLIIDVTAEAGARVLDLKCTKHPEKYWFMDWAKDLQSLTYRWACETMSGNPVQRFEYVVLNPEERTLFIKGDRCGDHGQWQALRSAISGVAAFIANPDWETAALPSEHQCRWCDYGKVCTRRHKTTLRQAAASGPQKLSGWTKKAMKLAR